MRPIDANPLIDKFTKEAQKTSDVSFAQALMYVITCLDCAPTIEQPTWISVDDRLPDDNDRVIAFRPNEAEVSAYRYCTMWGWSVKLSLKHKGITHWMPLLQPPKGVE